MADVNDRREDRETSGTNWALVIAVLVLVLLIAWFFFQGDTERPAEVEVDVPQAEAPDINVPDEIDVNVRDGGDPQ